MSSQKESTVRTLVVALLVCLVCSVFVAGAAIALKPTQVENRQLDKQRSILAIAGLWSTLYGFIAIKGDLNTVAGMGFYQHAETPGLGGEVDNPKWKAQWLGKTLFDEDGKLSVAVVKGGVDPQSPKAVHQVDALAGATLTSKGVDNLLNFWLGQNGFGPFIANLRAGEA